MKLIRSVVLSAGAILGVASAQDLGKGIEQYRQGKYSESESTLRQAVSAKGEDQQANLYLGLALLEQKKASDAEPFLKKADELGSSDDTKAGLARLHIERNEYDQADAMLKDTSGDNAAYAKALVQFGRKQYAEAAPAFEAVLEKQPENAYAHYYAGLAYNNLKRPDKMLTHFQHFVKMRPDAPEARKVQSALRSGR
jgi:tetratricopeptide (TPR) repeat protein